MFKFFLLLAGGFLLGFTLMVIGDCQEQERMKRKGWISR